MDNKLLLSTLRQNPFLGNGIIRNGHEPLCGLTYTIVVPIVVSEVKLELLSGTDTRRQCDLELRKHKQITLRIAKILDVDGMPA